MLSSSYARSRRVSSLKKKDLWLAFADLEKAFDRVPREVVWWALRRMDVQEGLLQVIKSMYDDVTTSVKHNGGEGRFFEIKVGVHQSSVLSPILFIIGAWGSDG